MDLRIYQKRSCIPCYSYTYYVGSDHLFGRLPETAPPNRPNFPNADFDLLAAGCCPTGVAAVSFAGIGGPCCNRARSLNALASSPSPARGSDIIPRPSSKSPPGLRALLALSWTLRNFSRSSVHRMPPSSLPFNLLDLSKFDGPALAGVLSEGA